MSNTKPTLEEQHPGLFSTFAEFNETQDNPLELPTGFFNVTAENGDSLGFGFYCPKCKLHVTHNADAKKGIRHCNNVSKLPGSLFAWLKFFLTIKELKLKRPRYY